MLRATLIALAATLLLAAPASARTRCAPHAGERVVAHGSALTALQGTVETGDGPSDRLTVCVNRTGTRIALAHAEIGAYFSDTISSARVWGWRVAWIGQSYDHYGNGGSGVTVLDVRRGAPARAPVELGHFSSWGLGPHGEIAWIGDGHARLWQWAAAAPRGRTRTLDTGVALTRVTFDNRSVRWRHSGVSRSEPIALAVDHCAASDDGTADVALVNGEPAICFRATGRITPLPPHVTNGFDIAGAFVAMTTATEVLCLDAATGAVIREVAVDGAWGPLVDERGELSWTVRRLGVDELWVSDGLGVHQIASTGAIAMRDGSSIWWYDNQQYELQPPSVAMQ